jgi:NAD(P)H-hydrate epimerase
VTVVYPKRNEKQALFVNLVEQVTDVGIEVLYTVPEDVADAYDIVIDAVFGFSFKRPLRDPFPTVLTALASVHPSKLVSVDVR